MIVTGLNPYTYCFIYSLKQCLSEKMVVTLTKVGDLGENGGRIGMKKLFSWFWLEVLYEEPASRHLKLCDRNSRRDQSWGYVWSF